ncbi:TrbG/VirB9 family P-type conjugative transfer protein [Paenalcaligenes hermetiae]|uniref:Lipoprotein n=1 Tax=Paenalcaligenes hermetiae TaxID=1157987 RepID=A0ABP9LYD7_9BURK
MSLKKWVVCFGAALVLSGCEHTHHGWENRLSLMKPHWDMGAEHFDFMWRLSGDREVAPLQVFSSDKQIWLQFAVGQYVPAIFAIEDKQYIPLSYSRKDPYVIVQGQWQQLVFRGGALEAKAQHEPFILSDALQSEQVTVVDNMTPEHVLEDPL